MLGRMLTPEQRDEYGITATDVAPVMQQQVEGMLSRPFSEVNLADMMEPPPLPLDLVQRPSPAVMLGRLAKRRFRRAHRADDDGPVIAFDRQMFLLSKQLAYFERYGKLYLGDLPLLHDPDRFRRFLEG